MGGPLGSHEALTPFRSSQDLHASAARTFDQRAETARSDGTRHLFYWIMVAPGILLLLFALYSWWADPGWWSPSGPGTILGAPICGAGLVIIPTLARLAVNSLVEVSVGDSGIRLRFRRGSDRVFEWTDPTLHGNLSWTVTGGAREREPKSDSRFLSLRTLRDRVDVWVTAEAGSAIVDRAAQSGVPVKQRPEQPPSPGKGTFELHSVTFGRSLLSEASSG